MEKQYLCESSDNEMIKKFSDALIKKGIIEGSKYYYIDDNFSFPFFKLPKPYQKENDNDPDVHYVFVDVDNSKTHSPYGEYTIQCNFIHEHISDVNLAVELVYGILKEEIVEVAIIFPNYFAGFYMKHTGDHEKNVNFINDNFDFIGDCLKSITNLTSGHMHKLFPKISPYYIHYGPSTEHKLSGASIYMVSSILAVHPEYYIIK